MVRVDALHRPEVVLFSGDRLAASSRIGGLLEAPGPSRPLLVSRCSLWTGVS